jgi:hypothetical protein
MPTANVPSFAAPEAPQGAEAPTNTPARRVMTIAAQTANALRDDFASGPTYDLAHTD